VAIAIIPDEHCLSIVIPATLVGRPDRRATCIAHDHIVDLARVNRCLLQCCSDRVRSQ
jgi:hypothetical protein